MTPERPLGADAIPMSADGPWSVAPPEDPSGTPEAEQGQLYAALDLGTNSCRMLIAQPKGSQFTVIDSFSKTVQLGIGLEASGRLSRASMSRTVQALAHLPEEDREAQRHAGCALSRPRPAAVPAMRATSSAR